MCGLLASSWPTRVNSLSTAARGLFQVFLRPGLLLFRKLPLILLGRTRQAGGLGLALGLGPGLHGPHQAPTVCRPMPPTRQSSTTAAADTCPRLRRTNFRSR